MMIPAEMKPVLMSETPIEIGGTAILSFYATPKIPGFHTTREVEILHHETRSPEIGTYAIVWSKSTNEIFRLFYRAA